MIEVVGALLRASLPLFDGVDGERFKNFIQNDHVVNEGLHPLAQLTRSRNKLQEEPIARESVDVILSLLLALIGRLNLHECYNREDQENRECDDEDQVLRQTALH